MPAATEIEPTTFDRQEFVRAIESNAGVLIFKFGAEWCGPCGRIKKTVHDYVSKLPESVQFYEIDVDDSFDLYAFLKSKKIVQAIPTILVYYPHNKSFIPEKVVTGANLDEIASLFREL